jgi:membrane fusion protein, heavy metal efflux system
MSAHGPAALADDSHSGLGRIEARSNDLVAVGVVRGDRMTLHLSRIIDNSPVHDAVVNVVLRGSAHPATAQADGSYSLQNPDLTLPGAAAVELQITQGEVLERLKGTLDVAGATPKPQDSNNARQLGWWVLNFAVCIGFLWLFSRRKKAAKD